VKSFYIYDVLERGRHSLVPGERYFAIGVLDETDSGEYYNSNLKRLEKEFGAKVEIIATLLNPRYRGREGVYLQPAWVTFPHPKEK